MNLWKILLVSIWTCCTFCSSLFAEDTNLSPSKSRLLFFGGHRNRSHFKLLRDPNMAKYFAPDFIWDVRTFRDRDEFLQMVKLLRKVNPTTTIGSYASACITMPRGDDTFPPAKVPFEECKSEWLLRTTNNGFVTWPGTDDRFFLDMRKQHIRHKVISLAIARAKYNGLDAVCFDNCYWNIVPCKECLLSKQEWTEAFMEFFREAGKACHQAGLKCVVNVCTYADDIPDAFRTIAPYVDGLLTEMAFHPNIVKSKLLDKELQAYEEVLKQGKIVLLIPRYRKDEEFALKKIRPLARKYERIYLTAAGPVHHQPLAWIEN